MLYNSSQLNCCCNTNVDWDKNKNVEMTPRMVFKLNISHNYAKAQCTIAEGAMLLQDLGHRTRDDFHWPVFCVQSAWAKGVHSICRIVFFLYFLFRSEAKCMGLGSAGWRGFKETCSFDCSPDLKIEPAPL